MAGAAAFAVAPAASAIEPIRRSGRTRMRLSLAAYSFNRFLDLRKPAMTLDGFIDLAAGLPFDAVELTAYYFRETTTRYLAGLKGRCTRWGLDVSGTAVGNNFATANAGRLKEQIADVKRWIERTSLLGGKTMRIFAGSVDKGDKEEQARRRCIAAIQEACEHAGQFGIYLALENHGGLTTTPEQMLALVRGVKSDWFGVNLDTGNFHTADPYADLARLAPYAVNVQLKTEIRRAGQKAEEADLKRLVTMLRDSSYRGYVALEYEAAEDARKAVPRYAPQLQRLLSE
ncbi:MAG: sugar phosphate isomerase/epimerase [Planctomycetes bacterium]|nr:sugar phosphate isomerase/epimerase [Planctomycetota bacterium]